MSHRLKVFSATPLCLLWMLSANVLADTGGRLLATGGAVSIEATAGGGITTWAVLSGYGEDGQLGCAAATGSVNTNDYGLRSFGAACSINNRIELSFGQQSLDLDGLRPLLGLPDKQKLRQQIVGIKVRIAGDAVYHRLGQLSAGLNYKHNQDGWLARAAGATRTSDSEAFLTAGRLYINGPFGWMAYVNATVRYTRANQTGLLGFGGDRRSARSLNGELAAAVFPRRDLGFGIEYRQKPDNLSFASEDAWFDVFVAWFPNKHVSLVAAWTELGSIGTLDGQSGLYYSIAGSF